MHYYTICGLWYQLSLINKILVLRCLCLTILGVMGFTKAHLWLGPNWGPTQTLTFLPNRIVWFHQIRPKDFTIVLGLNTQSSHVVFEVAQFLRQALGLGWRIWDEFFLVQTLNMGHIGLIRWIMNIFVGPWKVDSFHYTFPSRTSWSNFRPHHFMCDKVEHYGLEHNRIHTTLSSWF